MFQTFSSRQGLNLKCFEVLLKNEADRKSCFSFTPPAVNIETVTVILDDLFNSY